MSLPCFSSGQWVLLTIEIWFENKSVGFPTCRLNTKFWSNGKFKYWSFFKNGECSKGNFIYKEDMKMCKAVLASQKAQKQLYKKKFWLCSIKHFSCKICNVKQVPCSHLWSIHTHKAYMYIWGDLSSYLFLFVYSLLPYPFWNSSMRSRLWWYHWDFVGLKDDFPSGFPGI